MEIVVKKFSSFDEADAADEAAARQLSGEEKLQLLLDLIMPEHPHEATIERSARVYPLAQQRKG